MSIKFYRKISKEKLNHQTHERVKRFFGSPKYQHKVKPEVIRIVAVIFFTFIYGLGMTWFLQASSVRLYAGGIPGVGQLIVDFIKHIIRRPINETMESYIISGFIIVGNIPILLLGWFGVSKKFVLYSVISIIIQATAIGFLGIDLFKGASELELTISGAILIGIGTGGALRFGTSTGGFDIVSQYIALRKDGRSVGLVSTAFNVSIALVGTFFVMMDPSVSKQSAAMVCVYTIIKLLISMVVMDKIHTSYNFIEVNIITNYEQELSEKIIKELGHGVTLFDVRGGYGYNEKTMLYAIIYSYEIQRLLELTYKVDRKAFIVTKTVKSLHGNFKRKTLA